MYRVFFTTGSSEYGRCFSDKAEAERFYNNLLKCSSYHNIKFQIG